MTKSSSEQLQFDFDRIAELSHRDSENNVRYHDWLLQQAPQQIENALDVGCGTGEFVRRLSERADHVVGIDLAPKMIEKARESLPDQKNIQLIVGDFFTTHFRERQFNFIASIATLHHVSMESALSRLKDLLAPGGILAIVDLVKDATILDYCATTAAASLSFADRIVNFRRIRESADLREAWREHAKSDNYLTLSELRAICANLLPSAELRRLLFFRYSLVWRKPLSDARHLQGKEQTGAVRDLIRPGDA